MKPARLIPAGAALTAIALVSFNAAAAADAAATDGSWVDLATPVYQAIASGHYALSVSLGVILALALIKRYSGTKSKFGAFVHSDAGGSLSAVALGAATAFSASLAAPGATLTWATIKSGALAGVAAGGGYAALKNLIVDPILRPLAAKAPGWVQPILSLVLWVFDHGPAAAQSEAEQKAASAGSAAVAAAPAGGATAVVGAATELK